MDFAIEVTMSDGTRTKHVDDVIQVLVDTEGEVLPIVVLANEDDELEVGFTTATDSQRVRNYYPDRIQEYNSFREEVRAIRNKKRKVRGPSWIEILLREEDKQLEFDFETLG